MEQKGHCPHGEFNVAEGCPHCIAAKKHNDIHGIKDPAPLEGIPVERGGLAEALPTPPVTLVLVKPDANTEVMKFYAQAVSLRDVAKARVITTNDDLKPANDDLIIIRTVKRSIEEMRKEYLAPFHAHVKETNEGYHTLMAPIEEADKLTSDKMLAFEMEQSRKRKEAEAIEADRLALARREAELNAGEFTVSLEPVEKPEAVPRLVRSAMGSSGQRANWTYEITDLDALPRWCMIPDAAMLASTARTHHDKKPIPGVRFYNQPSIATRR